MRAALPVWSRGARHLLDNRLSQIDEPPWLLIRGRFYGYGSTLIASSAESVADPNHSIGRPSTLANYSGEYSGMRDRAAQCGGHAAGRCVQYLSRRHN